MGLRAADTAIGLLGAVLNIRASTASQVF